MQYDTLARVDVPSWNLGTNPLAPWLLDSFKPTANTLNNYEKILSQYRRLNVSHVYFSLDGSVSEKVLFAPCTSCDGSGTYDHSNDIECRTCRGLGALWLPRPEKVVMHLGKILEGATLAVLEDYRSSKDSKSISQFASRVKRFQAEMSKYWSSLPPRSYGIFQILVRKGAHDLVTNCISTLRKELK
tara:strand:- start:476 stop:1036 length:561 start_codon:yes stop_codon:yes gene_type:complete